MWFFKGDADCFLEIRELFHVSPVCEADIDTAIRMCTGDFEDALQYCSAKSIEADVIVTRNVKDFFFFRNSGSDSRRIHLRGKHNIVLS